MAMIAVKLVLEKLAFLIEEETKLLRGVRGSIEGLQDDLLSMKSFLQDAEARSEGDQGLKTWVHQVRDVAYDAEDVLEQFMLRDSIHSAVKFFHFVSDLRARHRLANQIKSIKDRLKAISDRRSAFSFNMAASSSAAGSRWHDPRVAAFYIKESDLVGIESPKIQLIELLLQEERKLMSISVVGMGGLGKTTLVKKVYDSLQIGRRFGCRSWITVSQSFTPVELLRVALKGFLDVAKEPTPENIDSMPYFQLVEAIQKLLEHRRYVVVLDDIWRIDAWEEIKYAFPDDNCGSRIIFTTRVSNLTADSETSHVYPLKPLPEREAWTLFCKKAFGEHYALTPELEEISQSILKKCEGLPLAIVTIGGLLSKKKELLEWRRVHDRLATELKSENQLGNLGRILLLSYDGLPYYLKQCYLYLSVFPEDYLIKRTKLIRLWVVERFVEEKHGFTMEEVAEEYLNELVSRSLLQVVQMDHFNRIRYCRVHDLMRVIIEAKSREETLVMIFNQQNFSTKDKVRRLAIHKKTKSTPLKTRSPYLRSLLLFVSTYSISSSRNMLHGFKLLRVLELEGARLSEFPAELVALIQLRYLGLRRTMIKKIPESIRKLKNLEILDLKHSLASSLPSGISKLKSIIQIRNFRYRPGSSPYYATAHGMKVPQGIGSLKNLEKLGRVEVDHSSFRELGKLTQLKKLGILKLKEEHGADLCYTLERLKQLTTFHMVSINENEVLHLESILSAPEYLQRLVLKCRLTILPGWIASLQYLSKLVLQYSNLDSDPLETLQDLPSLLDLELRQAYAGEEARCNARGYSRLKRLNICQLHRLQRIKLAAGAMPGLQKLEITGCKRLETVPVGIEHLVNLQELLLWHMPSKIFKSIQRPQGEDYCKIQHIPAIIRIYGNEGRWEAETLS